MLKNHYLFLTGYPTSRRWFEVETKTDPTGNNIAWLKFSHTCAILALLSFYQDQTHAGVLHVHPPHGFVNLVSVLCFFARTNQFCVIQRWMSFKWVSGFVKSPSTMRQLTKDLLRSDSFCLNCFAKYCMNAYYNATCYIVAYYCDIMLRLCTEAADGNRRNWTYIVGVTY